MIANARRLSDELPDYGYETLNEIRKWISEHAGTVTYIAYDINASTVTGAVAQLHNWGSAEGQIFYESISSTRLKGDRDYALEKAATEFVREAVRIRDIWEAAHGGDKCSALFGKGIDALNDLHIAGAIDFEKTDEGR